MLIGDPLRRVEQCWLNPQSHEEVLIRTYRISQGSADQNNPETKEVPRNLRGDLGSGPSVGSFDEPVLPKVIIGPVWLRSRFPPNLGQVAEMVVAGELERGKPMTRPPPPWRRGVGVNFYSSPDESVVENASSGSPPSGLAYLSLTCTSL